MRYADSEGSPPTLEAHGIWLRFGPYAALKGVDLSIRPGEITALAGPNGAGKTTLFHVLNGNLRPDAGQVLMDGADVTGLAPWRMARRGVGRLFQDVRTFADLTVRENVESALCVCGDHRDEALHWLAYAGLADRASRRAGSLPLVERRLLALVRLLALKVRLLLLDEPMAGLPEDEAERVSGLVRKMVDERGVSVALVEHDPQKVMRLADTVCFLHEGEVLMSGSPSRVYSDSRVRALYAEGLQDGTAESVRFVTGDDKVFAHCDRSPSDVAVLRKEHNVFASLSVGENLRLAQWGLLPALADHRQKRMAGLFPFLFERLDQRAGTLSGGQRQALAIAMVMCRDVRRYFFDEPSAGLAPRTAATMFAAIRKFATDEPDREVYVREARQNDSVTSQRK